MPSHLAWTLECCGNSNPSLTLMVTSLAKNKHWVLFMGIDMWTINIGVVLAPDMYFTGRTLDSGPNGASFVRLSATRCSLKFLINEIPNQWAVRLDRVISQVFLRHAPSWSDKFWPRADWIRTRITPHAGWACYFYTNRSKWICSPVVKGISFGKELNKIC